jgi:hypothetical protein
MQVCTAAPAMGCHGHGLCLLHQLASTPLHACAFITGAYTLSVHGSFVPCDFLACCRLPALALQQAVRRSAEAARLLAKSRAPGQAKPPQHKPHIKHQIG